MKKLFAVFLISFISFTSFSYELGAYKKPIPFYDYLVESQFEKVFRKSVQRNRWSLSRDENQQFNATILHKTYNIKTALVIENKTVRIELLSVDRQGCSGKCKIDNEKVEGWLLRLRKSLAYDITLVVKKDALRKSLS